MTGDMIGSMNRLGALVGLELKNQFGPATLWWQFKHGQSRWRLPLIGALLFLAALPLLYTFILMIRSAYGLLHVVGQESALVGVGVIIGQFAVFVLGLFNIISTFYFSNDLERLIPLPVRPNQFTLSKLVVVLCNQWLMIAPLVLPLLLGYGILARSPLGFWVLLVPVYLLLPVIPVALSALIAMGLMRVVNLSRKKDALVVVGGLTLIVLNVIFQTRAHRPGESEVVQRLLTDQNGLIRIIGRNFPPCVWASRSLILGVSIAGALQFLLLAATSGVVIVGIVALSEKLYYGGVIGLREIASKRRGISRGEMEKRVSSGSHPLRAIFKREFLLMNRTPIFLLNGVLVVVILPAVFLFGFRTDGGDAFRALFGNLGSIPPASLILGLVAFYLVCGCLNGTAASALSREGRHFWISRIIPVPWAQQVKAKFLHSYLVSLVGIIAASVVSLLTVRTSMWYVLAAVLLALVGSIPLIIIGLRIDLARPLLNWTNPQRAIKQNFNVFLAMVLDLSFVACCGLLARILVRAQLSDTLIYVILLSLVAATAGIGWRELLAFAERKYPRIEPG